MALLVWVLAFLWGSMLNFRGVKVSLSCGVLGNLTPWKPVVSTNVSRFPHELYMVILLGYCFSASHRQFNLMNDGYQRDQISWLTIFTSFFPPNLHGSFPAKNTSAMPMSHRDALLPRTCAHGRRLQPDSYGNWSGWALRAWSNRGTAKVRRNRECIDEVHRSDQKTITVWILSLRPDFVYFVDCLGQKIMKQLPEIMGFRHDAETFRDFLQTGIGRWQNPSGFWLMCQCYTVDAWRIWKNSTGELIHW